MKTVGSRAALRSGARRLSMIIVKRLHDTAGLETVDLVEQYRLGKVGLECIDLRRSLLEERPGPKRSEEEELKKMEQQVAGIMARSREKMERSGNGLSELKRASKELQAFWRRRKQSKTLS